MAGDPKEAIDLLRKQPGASALREHLDILERYVTASPHSDDGQEIRLEILLGKSVTINGTAKSLSAIELKQLVEFLHDQPVTSIIALQEAVSHFEMAEALNRAELLNVLRDIDFTYVPPGLVLPQDLPFWARTKIYAYAYDQSRSLEQRNKIYNSAYLHFLSDTNFTFNENSKLSTIDAAPGFAGAYLEAFKIATDKSEHGEAKLLAMRAVELLHQLNTHDNRKEVNDQVEAYALGKPGPLSDFAAASRRLLTPQELISLDIEYKAVKKRMTSLGTLPKSFTSAKGDPRNGAFNTRANDLYRIANELNKYGFVPGQLQGNQPRLSEFLVYVEQLKSAMDRFVKEAKNPAKASPSGGDPAKLNPAAGVAIRQYLKDKAMLNPYIRQLELPKTSPGGMPQRINEERTKQKRSSAGQTRSGLNP